MKRIEAYRDIKEMTPEVLLELTQSHKFQSMRNAFKYNVSRNLDFLDFMVTEGEIEAMGETLKMVVFFVSPAIMRSTIELARDKGVLAIPSKWL